MPVEIKDPNLLLRAFDLVMDLRERRDEAKIIFGREYDHSLYHAASAILLRQKQHDGTIIDNAYALMKDAERDFAHLPTDAKVFANVVSMYCAAAVELHDGYNPEESPYAN